MSSIRKCYRIRYYFLITYCLFIIISCQKNPNNLSTPPNNNPPLNPVIVNTTIDSIIYKYFGDQQFLVNFSSYVFYYNGDSTILSVRRVDTVYDAQIRSKHVKYITQQFTYDISGRPIKIYSKAVLGSFNVNQLILSNTSIENFEITFDYYRPNLYQYFNKYFPKDISLSFFSDSAHLNPISQSSIIGDEYFFPFTYLNQDIYYYCGFNKDTARIYDNDNYLWLGAPDIGTSNDNLFLFDPYGNLADYNVTSLDYFHNPFIERKIHFQQDSLFSKCIQQIFPFRSMYAIPTWRFLERYHDLGSLYIYQGLEEQLKGISLGSTDSTYYIGTNGNISLIELSDYKGKVIKDQYGRIDSVIKQNYYFNYQNRIRPPGQYNFSQTYLFKYKK